MKTRLFLTFALLLGAVSAAFGQSSVKGTVTSSEDNQPLAGVSVFYQGTTVGTVTDVDGTFILPAAPQGAKSVVFSCIGFEDAIASISSVINIALSSDSEYLDEVVVTALGISREKKALGYAVQDLKSDQLVQAGSSSLSSAIAGKLSGVQINTSSGMPGASAKITIRGSRSLDGDNTPLYVVDGMPVSSAPDFSTGDSVTGSDYSSRSLDIDPNDIESINVLKGQAASALYGMRASNGVIVITTKKGSSAQVGKTAVTFTTNLSFDKVATVPQVQTQYAQGSKGSYSPTSSKAWGPEIAELANDPTYGGNTDNAYTQAYGMHSGMYYVKQLAQAGENPWATPQTYDNIRDFFKTGSSFSNNVSVAHNAGTSNYIFSLGNTNSNGIVGGTGLNRYNARFASDAKLGRYFTTGFSVNYVQSSLTKQSGANDGIIATLYGCPSSYNLAGIPYHVDGDPYSQTLYRSLTFDNPYWAIENNKYAEKSQRFYGNAYLDFKTDFNSNGKHLLDVKYQLGADSYTTSYEDNKGYGSTGAAGEITEQVYTVTQTNSLLTANYTWNINSNWTFTALAGNEINYSTTKYIYGYGNGYNFAGWNSLNNIGKYQSGSSYGKSLNFGTFGEITVDYSRMIFLGATVRSDYVSSMPHGNRTFTYPSVSLGFVFTELDALNNNVLTFGKLRASYAEVGQAGKYYQSYYDVPSFGGGFSSGTPAMFPTNGVSSFTPSSVLYDENLRPQNTKSWEVGTDLEFFDGRISLNYTFSRQNVVDQIFEVPMAGSTGYSSMVMNAGRVHTNAHELTLGVTPIQTKDFTWDLNVNWTKIDNYVDELAEGVESIFLGGFVEPQVRAGIGDKYPVLYGYDYVRDDNGVVVVDEDGYPMAGELAVIGSVSPDFNMGFGTSFDWKGLRLSMTFDWKKGGDMYAGTLCMMDYYGTSQLSADYRNKESFIFDYEPSVKEDGTPNDIYFSGSDAEGYFSTLNDISKYFIRDASYLKLREISLSYPFVKAKWGSISANIFGRNILLWTAIDGFDPEASQGNNNMSGGFERFSLPGSSSFGAGFTFKF